MPCLGDTTLFDDIETCAIAMDSQIILRKPQWPIRSKETLRPLLTSLIIKSETNGIRGAP